METKWSLGTAAVMVGALLATGCGSTGSAEEPQPTVTETVTATPEPESSAEDKWLDEIWDDHIDGIIDWWTMYHHVDDCTPERRACFDSFAAGYDLMADYSDAIRENDLGRPSYVDGDYRVEVAEATFEFSLWRVQCSIRTDECSEQSSITHEAVEEVMNEALSWYEIEDGYRVTN